MFWQYSAWVGWATTWVLCVRRCARGKVLPIAGCPGRCRSGRGTALRKEAQNSGNCHSPFSGNFNAKKKEGGETAFEEKAGFCCRGKKKSQVERENENFYQVAPCSQEWRQICPDQEEGRNGGPFLQKSLDPEYTFIHSRVQT